MNKKSIRNIIESSIRKSLYQFHLIEEKKIAIALSGGKDSLTMLFFLAHISGRGFPQFDLHAFHVHGAFSCGPAITLPFLQNFCDLLHVPLTPIYVPRNHSTDLSGNIKCYSCARQRRTNLFFHAKNYGYRTMAFGHHLDDSIATLLLNLLHKGEFEPNFPKIFMKNYNITLIRPLILVKEKDILSFAQSQGWLRTTCQCPIGAHSKRKKVKDLICHMEQLFPYTKENLSKAGFLYSLKKALNPSISPKRFPQE